MLDSEEAMATFLNLDRCRARYRPRADHDRLVEVDGDRGRPEVRAGQGGRQLDQLKEGEESFCRAGQEVRRYGAAVVVMAFDEDGQADTASASSRSANAPTSILVDEVGFPPEDIIFDPEHLRGRDRDRRTQQLRHRLYRGDPSIGRVAARACLGRCLNVSFSFRGNNAVREAMHTVFLYHAIAAGMDMGDRQRRPARGLRRNPEGSARARSRTSFSTAARCDRHLLDHR